MSHLTRAYGAAKLLLKSQSPTIMVVGGVVAMGAGTILACKQTLKVEEILDSHVPALDKIAMGRDLNLESYGTQVQQRDRIAVYTRVALDMGKLYAVPGVLFISGAGLVFGGHRMLIQRNATLAIAFTSVQKAFDSYRQRVVAEQGYEADQRYAHGHVDKRVVDEVTGETAMITTRDWHEADGDPYNRVFEQGATEAWRPDLSANKMFISQQQRFAQQLLNRQGYLYLSEVYEALGFPESDLSRVVGWKVRNNPDGSRDIPFVNFGLDKPLPDDWKYNQERAIYLDFNCQGLIIGGKIQKILEQA